MTTPEYSDQTEARKILMKGFVELTTSSMPEVSRSAKMIVDRFRRVKDIQIYLNTASMATVTSFSVNVQEKAGKEVVIGLILADQDKLLNLPQEESTADLVRTVSIANKFPRNGYQNRLRYITNTAIDVQTEWLDTIKSPPLKNLDPRNMDRDKLLQHVMQYQYSFDTGLNDWLAQIDNALQSGRISKSQEKYLVLLKKDIDRFVLYRTQFGPDVYLSLIDKYGERFLNQFLPDYTRIASIAAQALLEKVLTENT